MFSRNILNLKILKDEFLKALKLQISYKFPTKILEDEFLKALKLQKKSYKKLQKN